MMYRSSELPYISDMCLIVDDCEKKQLGGDAPEAVKATCPTCRRTHSRDYVMATMFPSLELCDECCGKEQADALMRDRRDYWRNFCPAIYRDTDLEHKDFNYAAYKYARSFTLNSNLLFTGASGSCKTRIAFHLLKLALINGYTIGRFFPEDVEEKDAFVTMKDHLQKMTFSNIVLFDNLLDVGAANEKTAKLVGRIIDSRTRQLRHTYITTQITADEYMDDSSKYGQQTIAEAKRIQMIKSRLEGFNVVDCDKLAEAAKAQSASNNGEARF